MTHYWEPDADTLTHYQLPKSATGEHHSYAELAPPPDLPEPQPAVLDAPRPAQVIKALARIIDRVEKCEAEEGPLRLLSKYVAACVPGRHNAYANLRQYRAIQDDVNEATDTLHLGGDRGADAFIDAALERHGYPGWPDGGAS